MAKLQSWRCRNTKMMAVVLLRAVTVDQASSMGEVVTAAKTSEIKIGAAEVLIYIYLD
ncbi:hypothetical protein Hanom_Chr03g00193181 [Helianthus anomalus]